MRLWFKKLFLYKKKSVDIMRETKINPKYKLKILSDQQSLPACYTLTISLDELEDKICENFKIEIELMNELE